MDMVLFSKRLKSSRENANMKQSELSEKTGVTSATISAYENAKADKNINPSLENVCKIASVLNVSLDWLCGLEKTSNSENNNTDLLYALMKVYYVYGVEDTLKDNSVKLELTKSSFDFLFEYNMILSLVRDTNLSSEKMIKSKKIIKSLIKILVENYQNENLILEDSENNGND